MAPVWSWSTQGGPAVPYGTGGKWELYTRAMITAALNSELDHVEYQNIKVELQFRNLVQMCQSV
jgi:ATP-dependent phosphoenolpyruvate carboxykinase